MPEISLEAAKLFAELLSQVRVSPLQTDADAAWTRVRTVTTELAKVLQDANGQPPTA